MLPRNRCLCDHRCHRHAGQTVLVETAAAVSSPPKTQLLQPSGTEFWITTLSNFLERNKRCISVCIMKAFAKWSNKFKKYPLCCTWIAYTPFVLIHKAEAVRDLLLVKRNVEKSWIYYFFGQICGKKSFTCDSVQWKDRRKLFAPCFQSNMLKGYLTVFNEHSHKFSKYLMKETENDFTSVDEPISLSALDIVCECIMGVNIGAFENKSKQFVESLHRTLDLVMARVLKFWQWPDILYWNSKTGKEAAYHRQVIHDFSKTIIEDRKRRYLNGEKADDSSKYKSLLEVLLKLHIEDKALDEEGVRREVDTFIVAGHDTVATTIKWALYLIGHHPEVQEKDPPRNRQRLRRRRRQTAFSGRSQRSQVSGVRVKGSRVMSTNFKRMHECNRIYPSVPLFGRHISEETKLCGYTAPKGTSAIVMTYFLHRDEDVFPDPEKFDPDRFLPENKNKIPECAYVPFELGQDIAGGSRDGGEDHGVPHFEKLLPSLSGFQGQNVDSHEHHSAVFSASSYQVSTETQQQQLVITRVFGLVL
ncbi:cytochrome P450 4V2 [Caerostris extrusa]|uniref:Cytochrome P450 4V2 n=1 Tax=Caerostris extrusa TaxID=172846 RepID=A0AAV4R260_CAEEX|nr:cytochrome P450 4V2 [Caerostris extrusa]